MSNVKKAGIVFAVLAVVIVIAIVFSEQWLPILDSFLVWIQKSIMGADIPDDKIWHIIDAASGSAGG